MKVIDHLEEWLIAILIAGATALIFVSVVHRYGTDVSIKFAKWAASYGWTTLADAGKAAFTWFSSWDLTWSQELCIIMFVWMAKFGAAYGVRTGVHVGVDVLVERLDPRSRYTVILFGLLSGALFTGIVAAFGTRFVWHIAHTAQTTNDLELPIWIVYLAIPVGTGLMCARFLEVLYRFARTGTLPHTDESHVEGVPDPAIDDPSTALAARPAVAHPLTAR